MVDKLRNEIVAKDLKMGGLTNENGELHLLLNNKTEANRADLEKLLRDHKRERGDWEELRES